MLERVVIMMPNCTEGTSAAGVTDMPEWMQLLHQLLSNSTTPVHARLFITRLVIHVDRRHQERLEAVQVHVCHTNVYCTSHPCASRSHPAF